MLFSLSTWGDLVERRVARDEVEPTTRSLRRTGFYDMYIGEISEDAAGNFYVLTESGSGSRPSTTVCEFHGGVFEKQCYDIGPGDALAGTMVAGGEHTLFMLANPTGLPSGSGMARFELSH